MGLGRTRVAQLFGPAEGPFVGVHEHARLLEPEPGFFVADLV